MEIAHASDHRTSIEALLAENKLPFNDLPVSLENFLVVIENDHVTATAGLEIYGEYGLLRSLAVNSGFRNKGIEGQLLKRIEQQASAIGLKEVYLLTETAAKYFEAKEYTIINRTDVPADVQHSSEFEYVCPQTAIVMKKAL